MTSGQVPTKGPPAPAGLASIRGLAGTLVVVPLVAWLFGSSWTWERRVEPARAQRVDAAGSSQEMPTYLVPEGSQLELGIVLEAGEALVFEVPSTAGPFALELQAFFRDSYRVESSADGVAFELLLEVPAVRERGMRTRTREVEAPPAPFSFLRVRPVGDGHRVTGLRLTRRVAVISQAWFGVGLLALWLLLVLAGRAAATRGPAQRLLEVWRRLDPWLATLLVLLILLRLTAESLAIVGVGLAVAGAIAVFRHYFARSPWLAVLYVGFLYVLLFVFLPWAVGRVARSATSLYDFTIDHRMRPDGREINSDGIRFRGEAEHLRDEEFVVLALGDSFTYGLNLDYEDSYPYAMERILSERACSSPVRVVNFGWASSSPLLSLRLLEQVGARYRPDLILYNLDMTDFGDDLRYEHELRLAGDLEVDHRTVLRELVLAFASRFPALDGFADVWSGLGRESADPEASGDVPRDRFFATAKSLEETRSDIERGVIKNLAAMHTVAEGELGAPMALVIYPRAYQYSARESPRNWERSRYRVLGPYVREPFRYFEELAGELPYPVIDLLPVFETAPDFPLFFEDDPHWNRDGAALTAAAVARELAVAGLIPCPPSAALLDD